MLVSKNFAQEGEEGVIPLKAVSYDRDVDNTGADEPAVVKLMIQYFYDLDYDVDHASTSKAGSFDEGPSERAIDYAPDAYVVPDKRKKKIKGMSAWAGIDWEAPVTQEEKPAYSAEGNLVIHAKVYALGAKYDVPGLETLSLNKFAAAVSTHWDSTEFPEAVHLVYTNTADEDRDLRTVVADAMMPNIVKVLQREEVACVVKELSMLAYDLLQRSQGLVFWRKCNEWM